MLSQDKRSEILVTNQCIMLPSQKASHVASHFFGQSVWYLLCVLYCNTRDASKFLACQKCRQPFFLSEHFRQKTSNNTREEKVDCLLWECLSECFAERG